MNECGICLVELAKTTYELSFKSILLGWSDGSASKGGLLG